MKIAIDGSPKEVNLAFTSTEYNCSVKLVGRLVVQINGKDAYVSGDMHQELMKDEVKDTLIRELGTRIVTRSTYPPLKQTSPYFPRDEGIYLPNYLLYADSITADSAYWYSGFKGLIRELQLNDRHGFKVFELPTYSNNTYGSNFWPSKVWGIVAPGMVRNLINEDYFKLKTDHKTHVKNIIDKNVKYYPKSDLESFKKLIQSD